MQTLAQTSFGLVPRIAADVLARLRVKVPSVHCITNTVAQAFTANVLLAIGATPSMTISPDEIASFVAKCDALLVNLGTCDAERRSAIEIAIRGAAEHGTPWVLDPVLIDRSPSRATFARTLLERRPAVVRLNRNEFQTLSGKDATADTLAAHSGHGTVMALSGSTDVICDGARCGKVSNGHPLMAKVTAMGCAASALTAACLAVEPDAGRAAIAALAIFGVAGEIAGERAEGPGTFAVHFLDELHKLDANVLEQRVKAS